MKEKIQEKNLPLLSSFPFSLEICKRETELSGRHHPRNPICSKSLTIFVGCICFEMMGGYETVGRPSTPYNSHVKRRRFRLSRRIGYFIEYVARQNDRPSWLYPITYSWLSFFFFTGVLWTYDEDDPSQFFRRYGHLFHFCVGTWKLDSQRVVTAIQTEPHGSKET